MLDWARGLLGRGVGSVKDLASSTYQTIRHLWATLTGLGRIVGIRWSALARAAKSLRSILDDLMTAYYSYLKYLATVRIPRLYRQVLSDISEALARARSYAFAQVTAAKLLLEKLARDLVANLATATVPKIRWILDWVSDTTRTLNAVRKRVVDLLTHPDVLAEWLFGSLWRLLVRTVEARSEAILRYLLRNAISLALRSANTIEAYIARLL